MTAQKHTPGPWYAARPNSANGWWIVSTDPDGDNCVDDSGDGGFEEANARLIAAAPEMLEALYEAEEYFYNHADADHDDTGFVPNKEMKLLTVVRAAIVKAMDK